MQAFFKIKIETGFHLMLHGMKKYRSPLGAVFSGKLADLFAILSQSNQNFAFYYFLANYPIKSTVFLKQ